MTLGSASRGIARISVFLRKPWGAAGREPPGGEQMGDGRSGTYEEPDVGFFAPMDWLSRQEVYSPSEILWLQMLWWNSLPTNDIR